MRAFARWLCWSGLSQYFLEDTGHQKLCILLELSTLSILSGQSASILERVPSHLGLCAGRASSSEIAAAFFGIQNALLDKYQNDRILQSLTVPVAAHVRLCLNILILLVILHEVQRSTMKT